MSEKTTAFLKNALKAIISLGIGLLIFLWIYGETDLTDLWTQLRSGIHYQWIVLALIFTGLGEIVRGIRWKQLITPLGKTPKTSNLIYSVFVNYLVNLILPRMGEVSRCAIISKYEKISFTKTIGTLITERAIDLFSMIMVVFVTFLILTNYFYDFLAQKVGISGGIIEIFTSVWLYAGIIVIAVLIWFVFTRFREVALIRKINQAAKNIWIGIKTIRQVEGKFQFCFLTLLLWVIYFCQFYFCVFAFDFTSELTPLQGLFIFVMGNFGIIVPVQGGLGTWHWMVIYSMVFLGIAESDAKIFALVVHGTQMLLSILLGIVGLIALPLNNRKSY